MSSIDPTSSVTIGNMMPGLVSGLDTESMVEKLLSGTQSKIDKQYAKKQQIEWKQEIYRDIITKLDNFRTKFFTFSSPTDTNLLSNAFFNVMNSTSSSGAVKVISSSSQAASNIRIDSIDQLATAYQVSTNSSLTVSKVLEGGAIDAADLAAFAGEELSIDVSLDGVKKTIRFQGAGNVTDLVTNLNESLRSVFGNTITASELNGGLKFDGSGSSHTIILTDTIGGDSLKKLGFMEGASNKLNYNALLSEAPFATKLQGASFEFSINGTVIKANGNDTVGDVLNRINNSDAGVRVTYNSITDKFTMESKMTGDIADIEIKQTQGNLLSAMFGSGQGSGITGSMAGMRSTDTLTGFDEIDDGLLDSIMSAARSGGQSFKFHLNGRAVEVGIPALAEDDPDYDKSSFIQAINDQLDTGLGAGNVRLSETADHHIQIKSANGYTISFDEEDLLHNVNDAFGFSAGDDTTQALVSQEVTKDSTLGALGLTGSWTINGTDDSGNAVTQTLVLDSSWTVEQLTQKFNDMNIGTLAFDPVTKSLSISNMTGKNVSVTGDANGENTLKQLFGEESLSFNTTGDPLEIKQGQNAKLTVDGTAIERNTNEFSINGVNIELMTESTGPISLTTERDTDKIVSGIKEFVEDYNSIVDELNGYLTEKSNYRSYPPLTDAQKKEMTEKDIERWEEKAKQGLLRNDGTIDSFLGSMRSVMYKTVESAGMALYDIGLDTSSDYKDNGKLILDEEKLRAALSTNLDKVQQLFSNKTDGVGQALGDILKDTANISSGSPGILVEYAGAKTALDKQNTLSKELSEISDRIKELNKKYEAERARYWQQFSAMEQALSQLNSQSSWVTQQFSGSN